MTYLCSALLVKVNQPLQWMVLASAPIASSLLVCNSWSITRRYKSCTFPSPHQQIRRPSSPAPIHSFKQNIFPPDQTLNGYGSSFVSLAAFNACYWYFFHLFCRRDLWYVHQPRKYVSPLTDESVVGFYTHSLALVADAFHYVCFEIVFNFVKIWYLIQII